MQIFATMKYDGVLSLLWVSLWAVCLYTFIFSRHVAWEHFMPFFLVLLALWWGVGLVLAISALRRGSPANFICGLATILGFICFLRWLTFPVH
jgi:hypothetical protein